MAEDKIKMKKKTKEIKENIYALDFDNLVETPEGEKIEEINVVNQNDELDGLIKRLKTTENIDEFVPKVLKDLEEDDTEIEDDEPKKKKVLSKIEEGIKSSKRGRGRPRKKPAEKEKKAT